MHIRSRFGERGALSLLALAASPLAYARGLLRWEVLEEIPPRLSYLLGNERRALPTRRLLGLRAEYTQRGDKMAAAHRRELEAKPYANAQRYGSDPQAGMRYFPAADRIGIVAASLPEEAALILVVPPLYKNSLPPEGTEQAFRLQACKAAIVGAAQKGHARTALVDWRIDRPEIGKPAWFFDKIHYRQPIAQAMEADIAAIFRRFR